MENVARCPVCHKGDLIEGAKGYMCNHFKSMEDKCGFTVFKSYFGKEMTQEIVKQLVLTGQTDFYDNLVSKENKVFRAKLVIEDGLIKPHFQQNALDTPCPKCGKKVLSTSKAFICEGGDLYINKTVASVILSDNEVEILLNGGLTDYRTDFLSANKKEFGAKLYLDDDYQVKFNHEIIKCPKCKTGSVSSNQKAYGCSNYKHEAVKCDFTIWREVSGKKITLEQLTDLCQKGYTDTTKFKPRDGKEYTGFYKLDDEFKLTIVPVG